MEKIQWLFMGMAMQAFISSSLSILGIIELAPGPQFFAGVLFMTMFVLVKVAIDYAKKKRK